MVMPMTEDVQIIVARAGRHPHDYRCKGCGRLLFRAVFSLGTYVEIRCYKSQCRTINIFHNVNGNEKDIAEP